MSGRIDPVTRRVVGAVQMYENLYFSAPDGKACWYVIRPWDDCCDTKGKNIRIDLRWLVTLQAPGT